MANIESISFCGYKSFPSTLDVNMTEIGNVNVIIGKNNTGKSSVIDIVEFILDISKYSKYKNGVSSLDVGVKLDDNVISNVFQKGYARGGINGDHYEYGKKFVDQIFILRVSSEKNSDREYYKYSPSDKLDKEEYPDKLQAFWSNLASKLTGIFSDVTLRRLNAERNILPEEESDLISLSPDGSGASNLIRKFINNSSYDEKAIEISLLGELNSIMSPEASYSSIRVQQVEISDKLLWEIFLEEKSVGRFALSQSGSGLKTIILILLNLWIIPLLPEYKFKTVYYAFEEIENNLHPALQRRMFNYLYKYACDSNISIFITTHSHVAINTFFGKPGSKLFHVTKNDNKSEMHLIENYIDEVEILNDLDVRASDLLQTNGIIWVEGPSDRVYIKKWMEILCDPKFTEGEDYQFLYYGGRLLSHYTTDDSREDLINVLTTNKNAAILIDSDKRYQSAPINETKKRIRSEFESRELFCWITKGKEIENYISREVISEAYLDAPELQCEQYQLFPDYIMQQDASFSGGKVPFAINIAEHTTINNIGTVLDLKEKIKLLHGEIGKWNKHS